MLTTNKFVLICFITVTPDPEISSSSDGLEGVKIEAVKSIRSSKYNSTSMCLLYINTNYMYS